MSTDPTKRPDDPASVSETEDPSSPFIPSAPDARAPEASDPPRRISAADRLQSPAPPPPPRTPARRPLLGWLLLLGALGGALATALLLQRAPASDETDLLERLVAAAEVYRPQLVTADAEEAERYVIETFGWLITVPEFPGLQLVGAGEATVLSSSELDVSMPAFRYDSAASGTLVVFVYDYVLLDGAAGALELPEPMYSRLAEDPPVDVRRQAGTTIVTWRDRAVLYAAVTDDESLAERVAQSVP